MQVLNGFKQLMERIERRMASDAQLMKDAGKLVNKSRRSIRSVT